MQFVNCYNSAMNLAQLAVLSRKLRDITLLASSNEGQNLSAGQFTIFEDIFKNSPTSVQDIVNRTNLAQSFVSKTVAGMKQKNIVTVQKSPTDKRKVIITFNPAATSLVQMMGDLSIYPALQQTLPSFDDMALHQIEFHLAEVSRIIGHEN